METLFNFRDSLEHILGMVSDIIVSEEDKKAYERISAWHKNTVLIPENIDTDFKLKEDEFCWITAGNFSIRVSDHSTDICENAIGSAIKVEAWRLGHEDEDSIFSKWLED